MLTTFQTVIVYFDNNGWEYKLQEGRSAALAKVNQFKVAFVISEEDDLLEVITLMPTRIPAYKFGALAEFCMRVNSGIKVGRIIFDYSDGELRCQASAPFAPGNLPLNVIRECASGSIGLAEQLHLVINAILTLNLSPEAALASIANDTAITA